MLINPLEVEKAAPKCHTEVPATCQKSELADIVTAVLITNIEGAFKINKSKDVRPNLGTSLSRESKKLR